MNMVNKAVFMNIDDCISKQLGHKDSAKGEEMPPLNNLERDSIELTSVSYTHLTLPTIYSV